MSRRKPKSTKRLAKTTKRSAPAAKPQSRREFLVSLRNWAIIGGIVGIGGWYTASQVRAGIREQDLSRIGTGVPTIVQIHDPGCPQCRALQIETREALERFDPGAVNYVVANIRGTEGRTFADSHGVGHVTLVLFDEVGRRVGVIQGTRSSAALTEAFQRYLGLSPVS